MFLLKSFRAARVLAPWLLVVSLPLAAQEARQPEIVVTATRTPLAVEAALASVDVLDRETIEQSGASDVLTLLRGRAGLDIVRGGGLGQQTSVFVRGSNSNQVLVLIDGVRVASANTGGYAWEHLPLAQIERIEIVRGPRAARFGSDAIGGVIQIFTRRADGADAALGYGSHDTVLAQAGFGRRGAHGGFGLRAAHTDSRGFNAQSPDGFAFDPDRDGFRERSLQADGDWRGEALRLSVRLLHSDSDVEFDQGESTVRQSQAELAFEGGDAAPWRIALGGAREDLDTPAFFNRFESRRRQLEAQRSHGFGARRELVYGLSWVEDDGRSLDTFLGEPQYDELRRHRAGFASWRDGRGALDWDVAARHDDYDSFGGETSLQAALGWQIAEAWRVRAGAGEGFRAPTLNELYSPGFFGGLFAGNPELAPERSRGLELAADWRRGGQAVSLSAYRNRVRDLIDFSGGETFRAINIGRTRLEGIELEGRGTLGAWRWRGQLGWQRAENAVTGAALLRRPARKAQLALDRALGSARYGLDLHAVSARPEFGGPLPGYALVGAFARWTLAPDWRLDLRLDNLADRNYTLARGFNTEGFAASLHLRWNRSE